MQSQSKRASVQSHLTVATIVSDMVRSTLGPKGMDKMVVRKTGTPVVSGDPNVILDELEITNPVYEIIQGHLTDGTEAVDMTTRIVLLGELISKASDLAEQGLHPTTIVEGYDRAARQTDDILEELSVEKEVDRDLLEEVVSTRLRTMSLLNNEREITSLILDLIETDREGIGESTDIHEIVGGDMSDSTIVSGACIEKCRPVNSTRVSLPLEDCSVLLTDDALDLSELSRDSTVRVTDETRDKFEHTTSKRKEALVETIASTGCDVVFSSSRDNADHEVVQQFADRGIAVFHQIDGDVMDKLARVTGANENASIDDVTGDDLGYADRVGRPGIGSEKYVFVENDTAGTFRTLVLRGGTEQAVNSYKQAITECLHLVDDVLETGRVVPNGGAPEMYASMKLRQWATGLDDRTQLVVTSYADVLESIPRTLAENAGMDPTNALVEMRNEHDSGRTSVGIDGSAARLVDTCSEGLIEPVDPKIRSVILATETANFLLRIDEIRPMSDSPESNNVH